MRAADDARERTLRRGRRVGLAVFGVIVSAVTAWWSLQIIRQVWAPAVPDVEVACRAGIVDLIEAVGRARMAAASEVSGEQPSLKAFRSALGPEWSARPAVERACASDSAALGMLAEVDALRYAEEHAVRYEAVRLARERKRARAIAEELGAAPERPK